MSKRIVSVMSFGTTSVASRTISGRSRDQFIRAIDVTITIAGCSARDLTPKNIFGAFLSLRQSRIQGSPEISGMRKRSSVKWVDSFPETISFLLSGTFNEGQSENER